MKRKIYLSAPISGYDLKERFETFQKTEKTLQNKFDCEIVNPMKNGLPINATTCEHMRKDLEMLLTCDTIFLMDGWNKSSGCHTELCVAMACGMNVLFERIVGIEDNV